MKLFAALSISLLVSGMAAAGPIELTSTTDEQRNPEEPSVVDITEYPEWYLEMIADSEFVAQQRRLTEQTSEAIAALTESLAYSDDYWDCEKYYETERCASLRNAQAEFEARREIYENGTAEQLELGSHDFQIGQVTNVGDSVSTIVTPQVQVTEPSQLALLCLCLLCSIMRFRHTAKLSKSSFIR